MSDTDADRFTRLYQSHYSRVLGYAMRRAAVEIAREATDEAFLIAWRRLPEVPDPPLPWLLVVARNLLSQHHRTAHRTDALTTAVAQLVGASRAEDVAEAVTERAIVLQAVAQLTERDRDVLMMTVWDGLTPREAAHVAGCSTATFTVRLHRARRRLGDALSRLDTLPAALPVPGSGAAARIQESR